MLVDPHTYASLLIAGGAPVTEVQHLLRHSSPQVTLGVYAHWFTEVQTGGVAGLAKALCGASVEATLIRCRGLSPLACWRP